MLQVLSRGSLISVFQVLEGQTLKSLFCAIKSLNQLYHLTDLMSCYNSSEFMRSYSVAN